MIHVGHAPPLKPRVSVCVSKFPLLEIAPVSYIGLRSTLMTSF